MRKSVLKLMEGFLNILLGVFISVMFLLLFLNIVLRYAFNSGIPWAEEMSRFLFVWITFLGAIVALNENQHLGISALIRRCPRTLKKILYLVSSAIVIYLLYMCLVGGWRMTLLGLHNYASTSGIPLAWMWGVGVVSFGAMLIITVYKLYLALFVEGAIEKLVELKGSEDELDLEQIECQVSADCNDKQGGNR